jgi:hypothetical protein
MRVEQAIYGTIKNGHALKCASGDRRLAEDLAQRLDLPDTEPQGVDWSPVTSGFPVRDRYVIARTFSDPSVGRAGMVVTHALICDIAEIAAMDDLRPLLAHLVASYDAAPASVGSIDVAPLRAMPPAVPELADAAQALVSGGSGPVVRIGTVGFEELIVALWGRMWPSLRRKLYFRLSFSPRDVADKPEPTIVCTPTSLVGRWTQQQRIMGRGSGEKSGAAAMLDGSPGGTDLRSFAERVGADLDDFPKLRLLEQAYASASATPDTVARLTTAVRLIERLSPDPARGETEKGAIVHRLVRALPAALPSEILALRNLNLPGLGTRDLVWTAVESWLARNDYSPQYDGEIASIIADALIDTDAVAPWRDAARQGLAGSGSVPGGAFAVAFWRWAKAAPRVSPPLVALLSSQPKGLTAIEVSAPAHLDAAMALPIVAAAAKHGAYRLHAVAAGASMKPADAARAQSTVEPGSDTDAMRLALRRAKPDEILDAVASVADRRLLAIAAEAVAKEPGLLGGRDMSTAPNRAIWSAALKDERGAWRGPTNPAQAFHLLLDEQIDGGRPPADLIDLLSGTPLADLMSYPRRCEVWGKLPPAVGDRMLAATADAWFAAAGTDKQGAALEPELAEAIVRDPRLDHLLAHPVSGSLADGLHIIGALGGLDHVKFRRWVSASVRAIRALSPADADLLGRAVASHGRKDVVDDLISTYRSGRTDLEPTLRHCVDLIGFFDKWFLGLSAVSTTEKWDLLAEQASELYPNGPDQEGVWERSGGKDSDLHHHGSGKERWRNAIRAVQNGRQPRISRLIQQMRDDFPGNQNLRLIANDPLFRN